MTGDDRCLLHLDAMKRNAADPAAMLFGEARHSSTNAASWEATRSNVGGEISMQLLWEVMGSHIIA